MTTFVRVYAGADGESHIEDVALEMTPTAVFPGLPLLGVAAPIPVSALIVVRFPVEARGRLAPSSTPPIRHLRGGCRGHGR